MSDVSSVSSSAYSYGTNGTSDSSVLGKDDFLQLLVTQLTNQDPLEPMSDTEYIAQLAQFSSLEQLQNLNDSMEAGLNWDYLQLQTINNTMATNLIGKDVRATYSSVYLDDNNMPQINFTVDQYAAKVHIKILNEDGGVVRTLTMEDLVAGEHSIEWDGRDGNHNRMENGTYTISITATDADGDSLSPSTYIEGRVDGIVYRNGSAYLQIDGLEIGLSNVEAILEPRAEDEG
ncbi:MAG: flagellar hook capping protein [candidate division Zixibacteria bacterium]|nr:flagellar hook capping protein [candidate division Zixibacteria bacterium]